MLASVPVEVPDLAPAADGGVLTSAAPHMAALDGGGGGAPSWQELWGPGAGPLCDDGGANFLLGEFLMLP